MPVGPPIYASKPGKWVCSCPGHTTVTPNRPQLHDITVERSQIKVWIYWLGTICSRVIRNLHAILCLPTYWYWLALTLRIMPCRDTVCICICTKKQREGSLTRTKTSVKTQYKEFVRWNGFHINKNYISFNHCPFYFCYISSPDDDLLGLKHVTIIQQILYILQYKIAVLSVSHSIYGIYPAHSVTITLQRSWLQAQRTQRAPCSNQAWRKHSSNFHRPLSPYTRWRSWLRHCATNRKVEGSIPDGVIGIFQWHNPSGRTMAPRSTQPPTKMSTRNISWGVKVAGA